MSKKNPPRAKKSRVARLPLTVIGIERARAEYEAAELKLFSRYLLARKTEERDDPAFQEYEQLEARIYLRQMIRSGAHGSKKERQEWQSILADEAIRIEAEKTRSGRPWENGLARSPLPTAPLQNGIKGNAEGRRQDAAEARRATRYRLSQTWGRRFKEVAFAVSQLDVHAQAEGLGGPVGKAIRKLAKACDRVTRAADASGFALPRPDNDQARLEVEKESDTGREKAYPEIDRERA